MSGKIKGLIVHPGMAPKMITIDNTLKAMQHEVGGYLEPIPCISTNIQALCDSDGRYKRLEPNFMIADVPIVGTVLFVGLDDTRENFGDLPERYVGPIVDLVNKGREALKWAE